MANQTLGGGQLTARITDLISEHDRPSTTIWCRVHVTQTDGTHEWDYRPIDRYISDARTLPRVLARARLERASARELERLRTSGVRADGETDAHPIQGIKSVVNADEYTAVLVSTLRGRCPGGCAPICRTRWRGAVSVPVIHVEGGAGRSL